MMKLKRMLCACLAGLLCFGCAACGPQATPPSAPDLTDPTVREKMPVDLKTSAKALTFNTSDSGLNDFLNGFFERHLRYNENAVDGRELGSSVLFNKEWEAMSLLWFDSTENTLNDDRMSLVRDWLENIPVDRFGYVWSNKEELEPDQPGEGMAGMEYFGQGWAFPGYLQSNGALLGHEFSTDGNGWRVEVDGKKTDLGSGVGGLYTIPSTEARELAYVSPKFGAKDTAECAFLEIDLRVNDETRFGLESMIDDIYVYWTNEYADGNPVFTDEKCMSQKEWCTLPETEIRANFAKPMYFPVYLHPAWTGDVSAFKIAIRTKDEAVIEMSAGLNYVRMAYDRRRIDNNALLINSAKVYYQFTHDEEFLARMLPKLRRAMQFTYTHMKGGEGLVDAGYFRGHDGVAGRAGHGISHSYWDVTLFPQVDLLSNIEWYKQVQSMAWLEQAAANAGIEAAPVTVANPENTGTIACDLPLAQLTKLAEQVRTGIQTVFWRQNTGRFSLGIIKSGGQEVDADFGYLHFNLEAVAYDIPTAEQSKSIMDWVTGVREVETDTSRGKDIYKFEFAPRTTTDASKDNYRYWLNSGYEFGTQMQDGGAVAFTSFFDLIARLKVYGPDNAYGRLKELQAWYEKVAAAGGSGTEFYAAYYGQYKVQQELGTGLQGNGTPGGLGLDAEFLETALVYAALPYGFFGMDVKAEEGRELVSFTQNLPSELEAMKLENVMYRGIRFDVSMHAHSISIPYCAPHADNVMMELRVRAERADPVVRINGTYVDQGYRVEDGYVVVRLPLQEIHLSVY